VRSRLLDRPSGSASESESQALSLLRSEFAALSVDSTPPSAHTVWQRFLLDLRSHVLNDDPRNFLRWKIIRCAMSAEFQDFVTNEFKVLREDPEWSTRWEPALQEPSIGNPCAWPNYRARSASYTSGNTIHQCFHLRQFEHFTNMRISDFSQILEFGAGYGSFCRIAHALGFAGSYMIYDFPEFLALQRYYLRSIGLLEVTPGEQSSSISGYSELPALTAALARPALGRQPPGRSLFVGLWSISETGPGFIEQFFAELPKFDAYLLAYRRNFSGIDNQSFFEIWQREMAATHHIVEIEAAGSSEDRYLFVSSKTELMSVADHSN